MDVSFSELTSFGAGIACLGMALVFVLSLYVVDPGLPRNHPVTVRRRIAAILVVCALSPLYLWLWSDRDPRDEAKPLLVHLGIRLEGLPTALACSATLVLVLYAGSIFQSLTTADESVFGPFDGWDLALRNFVVAPFAEEFVFRACMVPVLLPHWGSVLTTLCCPLFFGVAHVHHMLELMRNRNTNASSMSSMTQILLITLIQVCYTSVFGVFSAYLFIRTGHLFSAVLSHVLCNLFGLPDFMGVASHKWPLLVCVVYCIGLVSFLCLLAPLTTPTLFQ